MNYKIVLREKESGLEFALIEPRLRVENGFVVSYFNDRYQDTPERLINRFMRFTGVKLYFFGEKLCPKIEVNLNYFEIVSFETMQF
jgi:hypothetical protein